MSALAIASIVFVCVFSGALLGIPLRRALPQNHLKDDAKDTVRLGMGLVATISALVLGLVVASAKGSYDAQKDGLDRISANLIVLDTTLAQYGPAAQEARDLLRSTVAATLQRIWPQDVSETSTLAAPETTAGGRHLYRTLLELSPETDAQRMLQSQALQIGASLAQARWLLVAQQEGSPIPIPFLAILVFWLAVLFCSFGLFTPPNATVIATQFVCSLSVSAAILLILELAQPFTGLIQVSSAPLRGALALLGK